VVQIANGPASEDPSRYAARLLSTIVGDESGSRIFWELVDTGRAEYAAMWTHDFQGTGIYMSVLCGAPEDTEDNLRRMRQILRDVESTGVSAEELQQAKNKICSHVVLQSERPTNRLIAVGSNWLQRHKYQTVRQVIREFKDVTSEDIVEVIGQYPLTLQTTVAVGPLSEMHAPE
jgi:predicted Zn-dependent peptidase